jgi:hypothetical protein
LKVTDVPALTILEEGETETLKSKVSCQIQVTLESSVIVKATDVPEPLAGTLPVPVQPVQVQTRLPSVTGLGTLAETNELSS